MKKSAVIHGINTNVLKDIPPESVDLIYLDPPFFSNEKYELPCAKDEEVIAFHDNRDSFHKHKKNKLKEVKTVRDLIKYIRHNGYVSYRETRGWTNDDIYTQDENKKEKKDFWSNRTLEGLTEYLTSMRDVLSECKRVLKQTGSLYLHCDWHANHYLRIIMDEIFGYNNFRNEIAWCYSGANNASTIFPKKHDTIFFYSKTNKYVFNQYSVLIPSRSTARYYIDSDGKEYTIKNNKKYYRKSQEGKIPEDYWTDINMLHHISKERVGYPTQKPEALLERIIRASSNRGDVILDPFCGSGTTAVVAEKLRRRFIMIDLSKVACDITRDRLAGKCCKYLDVTKRTISKIELAEMSDREYEVYIDGLLNAIPTSYTNDKGRDGIGRFEKGGEEIRYAVQVKNSHRDTQTSRPEIDKFIGSISTLCDIGIFVAKKYSKGARRKARDVEIIDNKKIYLLTEDDVIDSNFNVDNLLGGKSKKLYTTQYDDTPEITDYSKW